MYSPDTLSNNPAFHDKHDYTAYFWYLFSFLKPGTGSLIINAL